MSARPLPAALLAPITDAASGKAWIDALLADGRLFHFEDSPESIIGHGTESATFRDEDCPLITAQVDALYALEWPEHDCPIGYALEALDRANEAAE